MGKDASVMLTVTPTAAVVAFATTAATTMAGSGGPLAASSSSACSFQWSQLHVVEEWWLWDSKQQWQEIKEIVTMLQMSSSRPTISSHWLASLFPKSNSSRPISHSLSISKTCTIKLTNSPSCIHKVFSLLLVNTSNLLLAIQLKTSPRWTWCRCKCSPSNSLWSTLWTPLRTTLTSSESQVKIKASESLN